MNLLNSLLKPLMNERGSVSISDISALLKKVIMPEIVPQLRKESVLYDQIKRNVGVNVMNNNIYISARSGRHSGIYSVAEGSEPYVGQAFYQQPVAPVKYTFGTIGFTDQALAAADKQGTKAIASILSTEIMALKDDFRMDMNRIMHGAGTGQLCLANGAGSSSTTLTVDTNPNGGDATEYLAVGMYLKVGSNTTYPYVVSVDSATQVTLSSALTWSDNDVVKKALADEPMGIAGIIDDGDNVSTIQGIVRATYPVFNAKTDDTSTALTEALMITQYLKAKPNGFDGKNGIILMGATMYQAFGALLLSMKRTTEPKPVLGGGWTGLQFMDGVPVIFDVDTWSGYVQGVHLPSLTIGEMSDPMAWLEADAMGGILRRSPTVRTNWEGTLKYYYNLVGLRFNSHWRLSGKTA